MPPIRGLPGTNRRGGKDLFNRIELHVIILTDSLKSVILPKAVRHIIRTGTLMWGSLPLAIYGTHRDKPLPFKSPDIDPIIDMMGGGF